MLKDFCTEESCFSGFTGIDSAYEAPSDPDLVLKAGELTLDECVEQVVTLLKEKVCTRPIIGIWFFT